MLYVQPAPGPQRPLQVTPARRPGSMRRTTSIDTRWPDFTTGQAEVVVCGQDLRTAPDGSREVTDRLEVRMVADLATGTVVACEGGRAGLAAAVAGASLRAGFSRHLAATFPADAEQRTLAYSALDDVPGGFLVSGYSLLRAGLLQADKDAGRERAEQQGDICIGWVSGGAIHTVLAEHGVSATPYGPDAPPVEAPDLEGWHPLPALATGTVRRRRQLDVWPGDTPGSLHAQHHFRDSYAGEDAEMALHEYLVEAEVDPSGVITAVHVDALVLPWEACPGAVPSAAGVVGLSLRDLEHEVRARLHGVTTCTHLNSTMRALADLRALAQTPSSSDVAGPSQ